MEKYFEIHQTCTEKNRPPISYKVREYLESFITKKVLEEKKIIVGGNWKVTLTICFSGDGPMMLFKDYALAKGVRTITKEKTKLYESVVLLPQIENDKDPYLKTIEMVYKVISAFLTANYKKVTPEFMNNLWKEIDFNYLKSLPYPAKLIEQKYIGDMIDKDGKVFRILPR